MLFPTINRTKSYLSIKGIQEMKLVPTELIHTSILKKVLNCKSSSNI